jgi:hypothetical protein
MQSKAIAFVSIVQFPCLHSIEETRHGHAACKPDMQLAGSGTCTITSKLTS